MCFANINILSKYQIQLKKTVFMLHKPLNKYLWRCFNFMCTLLLPYQLYKIICYGNKVSTTFTDTMAAVTIPTPNISEYLINPKYISREFWKCKYFHLKRFYHIGPYHLLSWFKVSIINIV